MADSSPAFHTSGGGSAMLFAYLVLGFCLWVTAAAAAQTGWKGLLLFALGWPFLFFSIAMGIAFPALLVGYLLQLLILLALRLARVRSERATLRATLAGLVLTIGFTAWMVVRNQIELHHLRQQYSLESMAERVPEPPPGSRQPLSAAADARLAKQESAATRYRPGMDRDKDLEALHRHTVRLFINSPGFGVARAVDVPSEWGIDVDQWDAGPVRQPVPRAAPSAYPAGPSPAPLPAADNAGDDLHRTSVVDFANLGARGYVEDRRHVAGFRPHRFSRLPEAQQLRYQVETIDLVGLLLHPEPLAYVSANLPRMDELRAAPTRPLDEFEAAGLEKLRAGEDVVGATAGDHLRMVGAIRNLKQCVTCHGGARGDLLGAFSYVLRRVDAITPAAAAQ